MIIAGILLAVVGSIICFRGVCIAKLMRAILGAIQGLIWAVIVTMVLSVLQLGIFPYIYAIMAAVAAICAFIAALREVLYRKIQGIVNALTMGGIIAALVYAGIRIVQMQNWDANTTIPVIAAGGIILVFGVLGIKFYNGSVQYFL